MVTTRRSRAHVRPIPYVPLRHSKRRRVVVDDTSNQPGKPVLVQPSISRTVSTSTDSTSQNRSSSALSEPTHTSPFDGRAPRNSVSRSVYPPKQEPVKPSTEQILAALKKLTTPGSSHNPIVLLEDSPASKMQQTPSYPSKVEDYISQDRHSKLYINNIPRPALAPRPANGSTFTGHPGHDMHRMRAAKMATQDRFDLPFETQCPISTRYLASLADNAHGPTRPNVWSLPPPPPAYSYYPAPVPLDEDQLRRRALQYVLESSRNSPPKRKTVKDVDGTFESDFTQADVPFKRTASGEHKPKSAPVSILPDPHPQLAPLIEQTALLTRLLHAYPRSLDQNGLRDDIARLASVQSQQLATWLDLEEQMARPNTPRVDEHVSSAAERADAEMKQRDDVVRGLMSAEARVWQDGSGLSVADVSRAMGGG